MADVFSLAAFGIAIFAFICEIIATALNYWINFELSGTKIYSGLWRSCTEVLDVTVCSSDGATDELRAVQAMVMLGLICTVVAIVCAALKLFLMKEKKLLTYAATGLLVAAGLFLMIGFAVYASEIFEPLEPQGFDLHAGFAFCVISWLMCWVAGALFGLIAVKDK